MVPLIIYHENCHDGLAGAWAVKCAYPDADLYGARYQEPPPDLTGRAHVVLVDFSYPRDVLLRILDAVTVVDIYDHHKSAKEALEGLAHPNLGHVIFDMNRSGAGIAWDVLAMDDHHGGADPVPRPEWLNYIEDYDLWRFKYPTTKPFIEAWHARIKTVAHVEAFAAKWNEPGFRDRWLVNGAAMYEHKMYLVEESLRFATVVSIGGHLVEAVNVPWFLSSETGNALAARGKGNFGATYYRTEKGRYKFSLRSVGDFDVTVIAKKFGGGGHRNAAGFEVDELPWASCEVPVCCG